MLFSSVDKQENAACWQRLQTRRQLDCPRWTGTGSHFKINWVDSSWNYAEYFDTSEKMPNACCVRAKGLFSAPAARQRHVRRSFQPAEEKSICVKLPTLTCGRLIRPEGGPAAAETGQTSRVTASGAAAFMRRRHVSVICAGIKVFFLTSRNKSSGCLINPSTFSKPPEKQSGEDNERFHIKMFLLFAFFNQ